ncbi:carboxylating nicotinate-nucleotide diphosphorylase [Pseudalkalibacillus hwajinpoensis]|uniref:Probable nicotinate-nucleotide pyrophosphorylase [carboxylating] n=1 Tax=Guptibacillus hwajinpoensis TaxID=208199 RepID=A0A4U1MH37_9BACL|nr:carboxylating nicotinate-nucleotide diphosphorylase [Pseudalkalibacillus hwajinpoensis]TKD70273.1 carboxylating nicotinate-nucleotide diphosphorylase [Pseudalkalibacillus hwajinpoensis]
MIGLKLKNDLEQFLIEDIGSADLSSELLFHAEDYGEAVFIVKEDGVFCGKEVIEVGFNLIDKDLLVDVYVEDGDAVLQGDVISKVKGRVRAILTGERVILNMIQRMSGISTMTAQSVEILNSSQTRISDTRKTTPGLRMYEKYAVRCGGGYNHRITLDGGVMLKDNHIAQFGSIERAVEHVRKRIGHMTKVEVETNSEMEVREAVRACADIIMFDNCTPLEAASYRSLVPDNIITEVSGGISLQNLASFAETGVDYISLGCLTHSVKSLDISVRMKGVGE